MGTLEMFRKGLILFAMLGLVACGGSSSNGAPSGDPTPTPSSYSVTTTASGSGSISPTSASVVRGDTGQFTLAPSRGYQIGSVSGCGGSLSGSTYTTAAITAACAITVIFNSAPTSTGFGPQSSTFAADNGFDFAETFDGLQDWNLSHIGGVGNQYDSNPTERGRMPKLATGGDSAWGYFSLWGNSLPNDHKWIGGTGGGRQVWRGAKSASIDLGNQKGPSRLGVYFGRGYKDVSVFYMVWIPRNEWPTVITPDPGGVGEYIEGQPYRWVSSWKFNNIEMGCGDSSARCVYGLDYVTTLITHNNYDGGLVQHVNAHLSDAIRANDSITLDRFRDQWWGTEYRITNNADDTAYTIQIWAYDSNGTSYKLMNGKTIAIDPLAKSAGGMWDRFMFGGNNSGVWSWGSSMQSVYYVDDLIIDAGSKGQIGPRYFNAIR